MNHERALISFIPLSLMAIVLAGALWWSGVFWLRYSNFCSNGNRRIPARGETDSIRSSEIKYHNDAIYRDFEFFYKITLGILGGTAFLVTGSGRNAPATATFLVEAAGWLQLLSGILFSFLIFTHQKSKIERWQSRFKLWEPLWWHEGAMIIGMLLISVVFEFSVVPRLIQHLLSVACKT